MLFNENFEAFLRRSKEGGQEEVQIDRETVENGDVVLLGAHQFGHWLLRRQIGQRRGHVPVKMTVHASLRPTVQHFLHVLVQ